MDNGNGRVNHMLPPLICDNVFAMGQLGTVLIVVTQYCPSFIWSILFPHVAPYH